MKLLSISLFSLGLLAGPALAQETMPVVVDANGDGIYSADELRVVWVDLSDDDIKIIDTDADGSITDEELRTAWDTMDVLRGPLRPGGRAVLPGLAFGLPGAALPPIRRAGIGGSRGNPPPQAGSGRGKTARRRGNPAGRPPHWTGREEGSN